MLETKLAVVTNLSLKRSNPDVNALDKLTDLVADDLKACNTLIIDRMQSDVPIIPKLAEHLVSAGGKRLRPMLVVLAVLVVAWIQVIGPRLSALPDAGTANLGRGDYRLAATDGSAFTQDSLKGAPSAVPWISRSPPSICINAAEMVSPRPVRASRPAGWTRRTSKGIARSRGCSSVA